MIEAASLLADLQLAAMVSLESPYMKGMDLDVLNLVICIADIRINRHESNSITTEAMANVPVSLATLGRHLDSALVYDEIAEDICQFETHETEIAKLDMIWIFGRPLKKPTSRPSTFQVGATWIYRYDRYACNNTRFQSLSLTTRANGQ